MARVKSTLQITGSINGLSFYTIRGGDTVYVRTKGGPSARRMKVGEEFATVRKHQVEWEACVKFSKMLKGTVGEVAKLGDFNVSPVWNGLGKKIMALDVEHPVGERSLQVTRCPDWLAGYNLNRRFPFNTIFRGGLQLDIDTQQQKLQVAVSRINTANDLYNVQKLPYFRLVFSFGYLSNQVCFPDAKYQRYSSEKGVTEMDSRSTVTDWLPTFGIIESQTIEINLDVLLPDEKKEVVLFVASAGIEFGTIGMGNAVEAVKHACCGKIMQVK